MDDEQVDVYVITKGQKSLPHVEPPCYCLPQHHPHMPHLVIFRCRGKPEDPQIHNTYYGTPRKESLILRNPTP